MDEDREYFLIDKVKSTLASRSCIQNLWKERCLCKYWGPPI